MIRIGYILIILGFLLRIICLLVFSIEEIPDASSYLSTGKELFASGVFSSDKMMPLYPIISFVSFCLLDFNLLDILFSSFTSFVILLLSFEIFKQKTVAIISSVIYTFYPFSIYYAFSGLTETSFVFFVLLSYLLLYKKSYRLASVTLVISLLIRPTLDYLNILLIIVFTLIIHREDLLLSLKITVQYIVIYICVLSPWWIMNYNKYDHFVRLNLGFGEMVYGGNNPKNPSGRAIEEGLDFSLFRHIEDPYIRNSELVKVAFEYIRQNPKAFLRTSGLRLRSFWNIIPNHEAYRNPFFNVISILSLGSLILGSICFIFLSNKSQKLLVLPIFLFIFYLTIIHAVTIGSIRYRYPIEPFLIIFTSFSLSKLFSWAKRYL